MSVILDDSRNSNSLQTYTTGVLYLKTITKDLRFQPDKEIVGKDGDSDGEDNSDGDNSMDAEMAIPDDQWDVARAAANMEDAQIKVSMFLCLWYCRARFHSDRLMVVKIAMTNDRYRWNSL